MDTAEQVDRSMAAYEEPTDFTQLMLDGGAEVQALGRAVRRLTLKH